jgi:hypothetical protein
MLLPNIITLAWKNIEDKMVELVKDLRRQRLSSLHFNRPIRGFGIVSRLYESFCASYPLDRLLQLPPTDVVVKEFAPFTAIIDDNEANHGICEADFSQAMEALPKLCEEWLEKQTIKALEMISTKDADGNLVMAKHDQLHLATTLFNCEKCNEPIEFARFIRHAHQDYIWENGTRWGALHKYASNLTFKQSTSDNAKHMIIKCGLDPVTATVKEMDDLGAWFRCQLCSIRKDGSSEVMNWRQAVRCSYFCFIYRPFNASFFILPFID